MDMSLSFRVRDDYAKLHVFDRQKLYISILDSLAFLENPSIRAEELCITVENTVIKQRSLIIEKNYLKQVTAAVLGRYDRRAKLLYLARR